MVVNRNAKLLNTHDHSCANMCLESQRLADSLPANCVGWDCPWHLMFHLYIFCTFVYVITFK